MHTLILQLRDKCLNPKVIGTIRDWKIKLEIRMPHGVAKIKQIKVKIQIFLDTQKLREFVTSTICTTRTLKEVP